MSSALDAAVYVRYQDLDGRLVAWELYLDGSHMTPDLLRAVPLGQIDAWVNAQPERVRVRLDVPGPDLRRLARHFATTFGTAKHWVADSMLAQIPGSGVPQARMPITNRLEPVEPPDLDGQLDVPSAKPYGDDFYREVAEVYRRLAPWVRSPANVIADDNGVPVTTVHRWFKFARRKGFLEPGRRMGE
jgi:hypothetical protein